MVKVKYSYLPVLQDTIKPVKHALIHIHVSEVQEVHVFVEKKKTLRKSSCTHPEWNWIREHIIITRCTKFFQKQWMKLEACNVREEIANTRDMMIQFELTRWCTVFLYWYARLNKWMYQFAAMTREIIFPGPGGVTRSLSLPGCADKRMTYHYEQKARHSSCCQRKRTRIEQCNSIMSIARINTARNLHGASRCYGHIVRFRYPGPN